MMRTPCVSFDGKDCSGCKHLNDRGYCEFTACIIPCTVRATIPEVKPKTNADRIRSMSDGELAQFLMDSFACSLNCPAYDICDAEGACVEFLAKWLQQEADI